MKHLKSDSEDEEENGKFILIFDGGSKGNPGPSAYCFIIMDEKKNILCIHSEYIGMSTNNFSEYMGFLSGLKYLTSHVNPSICEIEIKTDSELIVRQMEGKYKIKSQKLSQVANEVSKLLSKFKGFDLIHISRQLNEADKYVKRILKSRKKG